MKISQLPLLEKRIEALELVFSQQMEREVNFEQTKLMWNAETYERKIDCLVNKIHDLELNSVHLEDENLKLRDEIAQLQDENIALSKNITQKFRDEMDSLPMNSLIVKFATLLSLDDFPSLVRNNLRGLVLLVLVIATVYIQFVFAVSTQPFRSFFSGSLTSVSILPTFLSSSNVATSVFCHLAFWISLSYANRYHNSLSFLSRLLQNQSLCFLILLPSCYLIVETICSYFLSDLWDGTYLVPMRFFENMCNMLSIDVRKFRNMFFAPGVGELLKTVLIMIISSILNVMLMKSAVVQPLNNGTYFDCIGPNSVKLVWRTRLIRACIKVIIFIEALRIVARYFAHYDASVEGDLDFYNPVNLLFELQTSSNGMIVLQIVLFFIWIVNVFDSLLLSMRVFVVSKKLGNIRDTDSELLEQMSFSRTTIDDENFVQKVKEENTFFLFSETFNLCKTSISSQSIDEALTLKAKLAYTRIMNILFNLLSFAISYSLFSSVLNPPLFLCPFWILVFLMFANP